MAQRTWSEPWWCTRHTWPCGGDSTFSAALLAALHCRCMRRQSAIISADHAGICAPTWLRLQARVIVLACCVWPCRGHYRHAERLASLLSIGIPTGTVDWCSAGPDTAPPQFSHDNGHFVFVHSLLHRPWSAQREHWPSLSTHDAPEVS